MLSHEDEKEAKRKEEELEMGLLLHRPEVHRELYGEPDEEKVEFMEDEVLDPEAIMSGLEEMRREGILE